jgi:hypothetical protein
VLSSHSLTRGYISCLLFMTILFSVTANIILRVDPGKVG